MDRTTAAQQRVYGIIVALFWFSNLSRAETVLYDTFADGSFLDGSPTSWRSVNGTFNGSIDDFGNLVPNVSTIYAGFVPSVVLEGSASIRTRVHVERNVFGVVLAWTDTNAGGDIGADDMYSAGVDNARLWMFARRNGREQWVEAPDLSRQSSDVIIQLDYIDERIESRFWLAGDAAPVEPQLVNELPDHLLLDGGGVAIWSVPGSNSRVRYVRVDDSMIPLDELDLEGDLDFDRVVSAADINLLVRGLIAESVDFDLNEDGHVNSEDHRVWVKDLKRTWYGDANLDGEFNSSDLVQVSQAGHYEDGIAMNSGWAEGDWDGNGDFDTGDLVFAFHDGGYEQGPRRAAAGAVPEPSSAVMALAFFFVAFKWRRKLPQAVVEYPRVKLLTLTVVALCAAQSHFGVRHAEAQLASYEPLGYWRFESEPGFTEDSNGSVMLDEQNLEQLDLSHGERGGYFPRSIVGVGPNLSAADSFGGTAPFRSDASTPIDDALTIEMFAHFDRLAPATPYSILAAQAVPGVGSSVFGWALAVTHTSNGCEAAGVAGHSAVRELTFFASDGNATWCVPSGIILDTATDYFIAASLDVESDARFYVKNLVDGNVELTYVEHELSRLNPSTRLWVHGAADWGFVDGLLDEVRLSRGTVPLDELLGNRAAAGGDFDGNGVLDAHDIDALTLAIADGGHATEFDLNNDRLLNQDDRTVWVKDLKQTWYGDTNLDGEFNSGDLVQVLQVGHYEDGVAMNSGWAEGDWNGDGEFDTGDLVFALQEGGYEQGPRVAMAQVPEPSAAVLLVGGLLAATRACGRAGPMKKKATSRIVDQQSHWRKVGEC